MQLANSVYCGALQWVVRFSPTQAAGTERSPVMMPTTSSFYKGPPREGKPPTDAGLSSKAKCTQALLLNLSSRLCLHGGWDPEGGATFGVWTDSGAVVGVWAGPGPGTQKRPALAGHCQRGDGGASLTQGVPAPSAATHLSTHHQEALGGQKQLCFFASPLQWKLPEWPHRPEPWQPGLLLEREAIGSLPKVHTTPLLKGTRAESSKHAMKGCNVFVFLSSFEFFIFSPFPSLFPSLLLCPLTLRGGLQGKFIPDTLLWQACKAISG